MQDHKICDTRGCLRFQDLALFTVFESFSHPFLQCQCQTCQPLDMLWWVMTHHPGLWWWVIACDAPFWRKVTQCWKICSYIYRKNDIIPVTQFISDLDCHLSTFKNIRWWLKVVTVTYIAFVVILWSGLPVKKANCVQPQNCWIMSQII